MNMPGGRLVAGIGGYIQTWAWQAGDTYVPKPINYNFVDVAWWVLERNTLSATNWYSGSIGAMRRREVADDWRIRCRVWWDANFPPEGAFLGGDSLCTKLTIGAEDAWTGQVLSHRRRTLENWPVGSPESLVNQFTGVANGDGLLEFGDSFIPYYIAPLCVVTADGMTDDSRGDDIVFSDWIIEGDSLLWNIFSQNAVQNYYSYLAALNDVNRKAFPLETAPA
jgi:hypothetical protein